jgi:hypothetical protein
MAKFPQVPECEPLRPDLGAKAPPPPAWPAWPGRRALTAAGVTALPPLLLELDQPALVGGSHVLQKVRIITIGGGVPSQPD